jgi:hypothetical protein
MDDLEQIKRLFGEPHRLTRKGAARMAVHECVDPLTGQLTGERYVDPIIIAALERQGYDPAPFVRQVFRDYEDATPVPDQE